MLAAGAAALGLPALVACGSLSAGTNVNSQPVIPKSDGPVTLTYWAWVKNLQKVADIFNATQDRIHVKATWIQGGESGGYAKILSAVAAGGGPDIAQVELRAIPDFALAGALVDLARYGAKDHEKLFAPSAWSQTVIGDGIYGIPQDTGPGAMFYNREVMSDIGASPPATWDEFRTLAALVKDSGSGRYVETLNPGDGMYLAFLVQQSGATWFKPHGSAWEVAMTDERTMEVAEYWDRMLGDKLISTAYGAFSTPWMSAAGKGEVLSYIGGSWGDALIEGLPEGEGKWAAAPMPRWPHGFASSQLGGSAAAVLANSKHPAEALEFLVWMCSTPEGIDAMIEHCGIGWSPAKDYIGASREKPSAYFSGQNYNKEVIEPMAEGQNLHWMWAPIVQRVNSLLSDGLRARISGGPSLVDFMPTAQKEVLGIMRGLGLDAEEAS